MDRLRSPTVGIRPSTFIPSRAVDLFFRCRTCDVSAGVFPLEDVLRSEAEAGEVAADTKGLKAEQPKIPRVDKDSEGSKRVLWQVPAATSKAAAKSFVDFQNDVTAADIKLALSIVSETAGQPFAELGVTTIRPPYTPVTFGAIAGQNRGRLFDPIGKTPIHSWHEANGAVFEDVVQWKRPRYFFPRLARIWPLPWIVRL